VADMKKVLIILLAAITIFSLAACHISESPFGDIPSPDDTARLPAGEGAPTPPLPSETNTEDGTPTPANTIEPTNPILTEEIALSYILNGKERVGSVFFFGYTDFPWIRCEEYEEGEYIYFNEPIDTESKFDLYLGEYLTAKSIQVIKEELTIIEHEGKLIGLGLDGVGNIAIWNLTEILSIQQDGRSALVQFKYPLAPYYPDDPFYDDDWSYQELRFVYTGEKWLIDVDSFFDIY